MTDLSPLTTDELFSAVYKFANIGPSADIHLAELRRRLSAGEQAEAELERWRDSVADTAGIETPEQARQYHLDREHDLQQAEARVAELESENKSCSQRIERQRIRLAQLEAIVANHREHYRAPIQKAADAARSHIVEWQEQYWRAQAAERERDRLRAALEEINGISVVAQQACEALDYAVDLAGRALSAGSETFGGADGVRASAGSDHRTSTPDTIPSAGSEGGASSPDLRYFFDEYGLARRDFCGKCGSPIRWNAPVLCECPDSWRKSSAATEGSEK